MSEPSPFSTEGAATQVAPEWEVGIGLPEPAGCTVTVFLDFDGVLHPEYGHPSRFFEALPHLASVLHDRPWVEWVVSSNWRHERQVTSGPWKLQSLEVAKGWLASEPVVADRVVGITPQRPDRSRLPERVLAYEREAQCLAWLRAWRPLRRHWLALDDRPWLFSPFCPQLFQIQGTVGLQPDQLPALSARLDAMRI